ncbi:11268_t:CDS:2, partial [Paraglomus occultum]
MTVPRISKTPPALPPRNPTTSVFAITADLTQFSSQEGRIPAAWLVALTRHKGDEPHVHSFWLSHLFDNDASTVFLCKQCHYWFAITVTRPKDQPPESSTGICPVNQENSFHHLHTTTEIASSISAHCCQCDFTVNVNITDPSIPMEIMNDLLRNRRLPYTYDSPSITNGTETTTELRDTVLALAKYLSELLSGNGKGIRITDEEFGFDGVSQAFFQIMDFHMGEDGYYEPPLLDNQGRIDSVKRVQEELYMMVLDNSGYINETIPKYEDPYTKLANIIGTQQPLFTIASALDPSRISLRSTGYAVLGCVEDVQDEVIEWAYKRAIDHAPGHTLSYLEALRLIAGERNSDKLGVLFAMEESSGKICLSDLKEACRELNLSEETVSDHEAVAAYKSLARAYPENRSSYRKHLSTIGKALNSRLLSDEDYS